MIDFDQEPVAAFDLPEECNLDHVALYQDDGDGEDYLAVPFVLREVFDDGQKWYHEPDDHTVTDAYREAVADRAPVRLERIQLEREIPTYSFEKV